MSAVFLFLFLNAVLAMAEDASSRVTGKVSSGGKPVAGVTVVATSPALLGKRSTITGSSGMYVLDGLPPGTYSISFSQTAMQTLTRVAVLQLAQTSLTDAVLEPGDPADSVTSTAHKETVLATPQLATTLDRTFVEEMPISRDIAARIQLAPGVLLNSVTNSLSLSGGGAATFEDGSLAAGPVVEDAVDSLTVIDAALSAEYGMTDGGVVAFVTRSGGETFSGSLRDTVNSDRWVARARGNALSRSSDVRSAVEATFGGHLVPGRVWFFAAARDADDGTFLIPLGLPPQQFSLTSRRGLAKVYALLTEGQALTATGSEEQEHETYDFSPVTTGSRIQLRSAALHYVGAFGARAVVEADAGESTFRYRLEPDQAAPDIRGPRETHAAVTGRFSIDGAAGLHEVSAGVQEQRVSYSDDVHSSRDRAAFVSDRWMLAPRWSVDAGFRYDWNDVASHVSPRIGVVYDLRSDGRARISANFAQYFLTSGNHVDNSVERIDAATLAGGFQIGSEGSARVAWEHRSATTDSHYQGMAYPSLHRSYDHLTVDGGYRLLGLLRMGGSYTLLMTGSQGGIDGLVDNLSNLNLWLQADVPVSLGQVNASLLQRYGRSPAAAYFALDRAPVHVDAVSSTDLAVTWSIPVNRVTLSIKPEVLNIFNSQAMLTRTSPIAPAPADLPLQVARTFRVTATAKF